MDISICILVVDKWVVYFCFCELVNLYVMIYSDFDCYLDIVDYE